MGGTLALRPCFLSRSAVGMGLHGLCPLLSAPPAANGAFVPQTPVGNLLCVASAWGQQGARSLSPPASQGEEALMLLGFTRCQGGGAEGLVPSRGPGRPPCLPFPPVTAAQG